MAKRSAGSGAISSAMAKRCPHRAGMHHQYTSPGGSVARPSRTRMIWSAKLSPPGGLATRRRSPEIPVVGAGFAREIVMTASGPVTEILLAEFRLRQSAAAQHGRRLQRPNAGAGECTLRRPAISRATPRTPPHRWYRRPHRAHGSRPLDPATGACRISHSGCPRSWRCASR